MNPEWRQLYLSRAKLKAVSRTSALIAGFAMVAMVEVQLSDRRYYDEWLLISFSVTTTALVSVHLFALMISTCMLPNIEAVSSFHQNSAVQNSPHHRMRKYVELAWILSTGVGLVLFLIEIALLIWLKFIPLSMDLEELKKNEVTPRPRPQNTLVEHKAAWAATFILIPIVVLFAGFAFHFYVTLAKHRFSIAKDKFEDLNQLAQNGDNVLTEILPHNRIGLETNFHESVSRVHSGNSPPDRRPPSMQSDISQFSHANI